MNLQDILVYIIVLLCVVYAGRHFLKFFKKNGRKWMRMRVCRMPEREIQEKIKNT